jgi:hypothetical protein
MNHYGQVLLDHYRWHRPAQAARIADPIQHFTMIGEEIQAAVTQLRDEILGRPRTGEDLEDYRHRGYRALRQAEELVLHEILAPAGAPDPTMPDEPETLVYRARLAAIGKATSSLAADWTEAPAG